MPSTYRETCPECDGYGAVLSACSIRQGHTHGNDPDAWTVECPTCEGEGHIGDVLCTECDQPTNNGGPCYECLAAEAA